MSQHRQAKADLLLEQLQRQQSGRLTLFLGAAPGVGKSYAMLVRAHELLAQQHDVVIGYIETHGRTETEQLLQSLPIIPRCQWQDQGRIWTEMDLDAILVRQPKVVVVDELAHHNETGSRHSKRWQDVQELLDAGIDVLSAMNIQHLESLRDIVLQITRVRVQETVPDLILQRIRDIRLIDLPVNELLERLEQGKVYVPEHIQSALHGFFSPSNLNALRELAIQTVAQYVDNDLRESYALTGQAALALQAHVLAVIDGCGQSEAVVRASCRMAEKYAAQWTIVCFARPATGIAISRSQQYEIDAALHLARQLGAETEILFGRQHLQALHAYALQQAVSTLVLPQYRRARWFWQRQPVQRLLQLQPIYDVCVLSIASESMANSTPKWHALGSISVLSYRELGLIATITGLSIILASLGERWLGIQELSVIFITAVVFVASRTRMLAAVCSALVFFFAYNFFYISPRFTLQISAHQGIITVLAFLAAALIAGRLAAALRQQVLALQQANRYHSIMRDLGQKLSSAVNLSDVAMLAQQCIHHHLHVKCWLKLADGQQLISAELSEKAQISAHWSLHQQQASGRFTQTLQDSPWRFMPLWAAKQCVGLIGLDYAAQHHLSSSQKQLSEAMFDSIAQAIWRIQLSQQLANAELSSETEKLRSALLSSVSHDLRSPLAAIIGAAETLRYYHQDLSAQDRESLLETIHLEGERLDRYIQNLLDMTRLGHQGLSLQRDWIGVDELVGSALRRLQRYLPEFSYELHFATAAIPIYVHAALIEQAIFNVLENAAKFSPPQTAVYVQVQQIDAKQIEIMIEDQGVGIPAAERAQIFDMFYSMQRGDRGHAGTGLGLTIVKAIVAAHQGRIQASAGRQQLGTCIRMYLPIEAADI